MISEEGIPIAAISILVPNADVIPNNKDARKVRNGLALPKATTVKAVNPRPCTIFSLNSETMSQDRWAPARPHSAPEIRIVII